MTKEQSICLPELATIRKITSLTENEKLFEIKLNSERALNHKPGQFIMLSVFGVGEAPISVSSSPTVTESFELAIRKVGTVTGAMHNIKEGSVVGIRGPFGTHFSYEQTRGRDVWFFLISNG